MSSPRLRHRATAVALLAFASGAWAAPVKFSASDGSAGGALHESSVALAKRAEWTAYAQAASWRSEGFEAMTPETSPTGPFGIAGGLATLTPTNGKSHYKNDASSNLGRFNTTPDGALWWETWSSFSIDFVNPISAFGFYGTDFADFRGTAKLDLYLDDTLVKSFDLTDGTAGTNGSLLFFGFADNDGGRYDSLRFTIGQPSQGKTDRIGLDDFVFGLAPSQQPDPGEVPEPASFALAGLALAGAFVARRRRGR